MKPLRWHRPRTKPLNLKQAMIKKLGGLLLNKSQAWAASTFGMIGNKLFIVLGAAMTKHGLEHSEDQLHAIVGAVLLLLSTFTDLLLNFVNKKFIQDQQLVVNTKPDGWAGEETKAAWDKFISRGESNK